MGDFRIIRKIYPKGNRFIKEVIEKKEYGYLYYYPVVIDIGANIGTFSFWMYNRADKIYAIEPVEKNVKHMLVTMGRNQLSKISVHQLAISNSNVTKKMEKRGTAEEGAWRISEAGTYPVRCMTLRKFMDDQMIGFVDLVKIDVETHEAAILSERYFPHQRIGAIIGECHEGSEKETKKLIEHMGYRYLAIGKSHFVARK
jgi:FkbM family methyltransferase